MNPINPFMLQSRHVRNIMGRIFHIDLPENFNNICYDLAAHRAASSKFLPFLTANLTNQTNIHVDPNWASQSQTLRTMAYHTHPDMIIRQDELEVYLQALAIQTGYSSTAKITAEPSDPPFTLEEVYDGEIEALVQSAYTMDYTTFGFSSLK